MNETLTPEQWFDLQYRIRQLHPELTDDDLQYHEAVEQDMLTMIAYCLQKSKEIVQGNPERQTRISHEKKYRKYGRAIRMMQKTG